MHVDLHLGMVRKVSSFQTAYYFHRQWLHFTEYNVFVLVASGALTGGAYGQEMQTHLPKNLDSETACCCGS